MELRITVFSYQDLVILPGILLIHIIRSNYCCTTSGTRKPEAVDERRNVFTIPRSGGPFIWGWTLYSIYNTRTMGIIRVTDAPDWSSSTQIIRHTCPVEEPNAVALTQLGVWLVRGTWHASHPHCFRVAGYPELNPQLLVVDFTRQENGRLYSHGSVLLSLAKGWSARYKQIENI